MIILTFLLSSLVIVSPSFAQIPDLPETDEEIYFGLYWGASGISKVLLQMSQLPALSAVDRQKSRDMAENALQSVWDNRVKLENGTSFPAWTKTEGSVIYPGQKYGTAGIVKSFLMAHDVTGNSKYLEWSENAIQELYKEAIGGEKGPRWAYSYRDLRNEPGVFITDLSFGSLGIIDSTLDVYQRTSNPLYLDLALNATKWLFSISYPETVNSIDSRIIPWYQSSNRVNNTYTTYSQGNSGAINVLLRLSSYTNNTKWYEWAEFITRWLIANQGPDGSWPGEVNTPQQKKRLDFSNGVSGILNALSLAENTGLQVPSLQNSITKGTEWILSQAIQNSTHTFIPSIENGSTGKFDYHAGMTGILRSLRRSIAFPELENLYNWLLEHAAVTHRTVGKDLVLMKSFIHLNIGEYSDLSYASGLAGLVEEFMEIYSGGSTTMQTAIVTLLEQSIETFEYYQTENSLWPRQIRVKSPFFQSSFSQLLILGTLLIVGIWSVGRLRNDEGK